MEKQGVSLFSSYLWGIETASSEIQQLAGQVVFILPMRNWNNLQFCKNVVFYSFHLTYEELKLINLIYHPDVSIRFHLTYEELKLVGMSYYSPGNWVFILPMRNWNQEVAEAIEKVYNVFILPMRNWNHQEIQEKAAKLLVFILPMRNWNFVFFRCPRFLLATFSSYLWGIETKRRFSLCLRTFSVFILPMRNWNDGKLCRAFCCRPFSSYLWGIETLSDNS